MLVSGVSNTVLIRAKHICSLSVINILDLYHFTRTTFIVGHRKVRVVKTAANELTAAELHMRTLQILSVSRVLPKDPNQSHDFQWF